MQCPACGKDMEKGLMEANGPVLWGKKRHLLLLHPRKGEVRLGEYNLGFLSFEAYICRKCKKVVLDYGNDNYWGDDG